LPGVAPGFFLKISDGSGSGSAVSERTRGGVGGKFPCADGPRTAALRISIRPDSGRVAPHPKDSDRARRGALKGSCLGTLCASWAGLNPTGLSGPEEPRPEREPGRRKKGRGGRGRGEGAATGRKRSRKGGGLKLREPREAGAAKRVTPKG
jgi:hypothetical protein